MATLTSMMLASWPGGMWASLIKIFYSFITNYAWAVIVFTICLKLILSPIDFLQRRSTTKMQRAQIMMQPEMAKLQKKYGNNQKMLQEKQAELYKKNGVNMGGSCLVMLLFMVSTLVIFITLYNSLGTISKFKITDQYEQLRAEYYTTVGVDDFINRNYIDLVSELETTSEDIKLTAEENVVNKYDEIKDSWLWVKNIWKSDTVTSEIPSFEEYVSASGITFADIDTNGDGVMDLASADLKVAAEKEYNIVMKKLLAEHNGGNGYYILAVLVTLVSVMTQLVSQAMMRAKNKNSLQPQQKQKPNWLMLILMPGIMLSFALTTNAAFTIYILTNSLMSTLLIIPTTMISNAMDKRAERKREEKIAVDYRRK